jgi:hypothetical protein
MSSSIRPHAVPSAPRPADAAQPAVKVATNPRTPVPTAPGVVNGATKATKPSTANPA